MNPKISVIMSVYNGENYIKESIESILSQSFSDFEFVIIDDASSDLTPDFLNEYSQKDSRIKIIKNEKNIGLTKSLNKAIKSSSGEYIARMDAGDTSENSRFAKQVDFLNKNLDHGLVGSWANVIDQTSKKIGEMKYATKNKILKKVLIRYNPIVHSSIMVRRSVLEEAGLYNEAWQYAQDYELYFRLIKHAKIANLPEYLVSYRISPNSITRQKNKQQILFAIKARSKAIKDGQFSFWSYVYLLKPMLSYILPYSIKRITKSF